MGLEKKIFSLIGRPKHKENTSPHTGFDTNFMVDNIYINLNNLHLKKQRVYMDISRRVNANASPDVPKPLKQWGGCASPLIQSFGCTDSARALRRQTAHAPFGDKQRTRPSATYIKSDPLL
jgi:hypothetical protein